MPAVADKVTFEPKQIAVGPFAVIVAVVTGRTVTIVFAAAAVQPFAFVTST